MGLFGAKKISYLGVDIGAGGVKLVELRNEKGRARLMTYGFTERMPDVQPASPVDAPQETAALLKQICKKAKTTTNRAVASLPVASVFSSVITVPKGADKDIREAVRWQAKKLIPVPIEEMVLDFKVIGVGDAGRPSKEAPKGEEKGAGKDAPKTVPVLITGASKTMVQKYVNVFRLAGLEMASLETESFALIRSLIGKDRSTSMIVDIGALRTNIIIVDSGVPYVTRSLDLGGAVFSRAIAQTLSLGIEAAEKMKCDIGAVQGIYPGEGLPKVFETTVAPLVTEMRYSLDLFNGQERGEGQAQNRVEKIVLTGGTSALPALAAHFSGQLGLKVHPGDPWARVIYPDGMRPLLDEIGYRFSVAVGLAMRDIE